MNKDRLAEITAQYDWASYPSPGMLLLGQTFDDARIILELVAELEAATERVEELENPPELCSQCKGNGVETFNEGMMTCGKCGGAGR